MSESITQQRKRRLLQYVYIAGEVENMLERLARKKNKAYIPAMQEGDGSKRTGSGYDKMAAAVLDRMAYEDSIREKMENNLEEMDTIREAIDGLTDAQERRVMWLRYIDGDESGKPMPWRDIAVKIYGDDDEKQLQAVYRIHGRALNNIDLEGLNE